MTSHFTARALAVALALTGLAQAQVSCFEPNFGTVVGIGDDVLFPIQPIGFAFPLGGTTYTDVHITTNGKFYLSNAGVPAPGTSGCCSGTSAGLRGTTATAPPTIAPLWHDLNVTAPGAVYLNNPLTSPTRTVITWDRTIEFGDATATRFTVQCQLYPTGEVVFYYSSNTLVRTTGTCLVGLSPGGGAAEPGVTDLSLGASTTVPTVYELFNNTTLPFDMPNNGVVFVPNLAGGYDVFAAPCIPASSSPYGAGCSAGPCAAYEQFTTGIDVNGVDLVFSPNGNGGYFVTGATGLFDPNVGAALAAGDDTLAVNNPLGFSFPYCGTSTSAIDVCSNGFVWLQTGSTTSTDFTESTAELLTLQDRICAVWDDFNFLTTGTLSFNALPGKAIVTWANVPEFGGTNSNTFQLQLFPTGQFVVSASSLANLDAIIGYAYAAPGTGFVADLSATPFDTGAAGAAIGLSAAAGSRPLINATFNADVTNVPVGSGIVAWLFGFAQQSLDLTFIGAPTCFLLNTNDAFWFGYGATSPITPVSFFVPNLPALSGAQLQSQAVTVGAPGSVNASGLLFSNGLTLTFSAF